MTNPIPDLPFIASSSSSLNPNHYVLGSLLDIYINEFGGWSNTVTKETDQHLLSIAPTRSGKGRCLILPNLLHLTEHSVFVIDPKGENALVSANYRQEQGHEVVIFNPYGLHKEEFEKRGFTQFQCFNPLANLKPDDPDFIDNANTIAEALIYDTGHGDPHWVDSARGLLVFLIVYIVLEEQETDKTLRRLHAILSGGYAVLEKEILPKAQESKNPLVFENVGRYAIETNEIHSIIATAETQTRIFKSNVICSALTGDAFDFEQIKHKKTSIYLILPSERLITQARYLRLILLVAMSQFMRSGKGKHQVLMMLDEFANLGKLNIIENGYGLIAGHGVTLWSFVQNLTQLQNLYPKNWETFIANSSVVTVSNVNDVTTAEYFSRRAGKQEIPKQTLSSSNGVSGEAMYGTIQIFNNANSSSINFVLEDALSVTNIYNAPEYGLFLFFAGQAMPVRCIKIKYDLPFSSSPKQTHQHPYPFSSRAKPNPMYSSSSQLSGDYMVNGLDILDQNNFL